jgi:hypothetical protein
MLNTSSLSGYRNNLGTNVPQESSACRAVRPVNCVRSDSRSGTALFAWSSRLFSRLGVQFRRRGLWQLVSVVGTHPHIAPVENWLMQRDSSRQLSCARRFVYPAVIPSPPQTTPASPESCPSRCRYLPIAASSMCASLTPAFRNCSRTIGRR